MISRILAWLCLDIKPRKFWIILESLNSRFKFNFSKYLLKYRRKCIVLVSFFWIKLIHQITRSFIVTAGIEIKCLKMIKYDSLIIIFWHWIHLHLDLIESVSSALSMLASGKVRIQFLNHFAVAPKSPVCVKKRLDHYNGKIDFQIYTSTISCFAIHVFGWLMSLRTIILS